MLMHVLEYLFPLRASVQQTRPQVRDSLLSCGLGHKSSLGHHPLPVPKHLQVFKHFLVLILFPVPVLLLPLPRSYRPRLCLGTFSFSSILVFLFPTFPSFLSRLFRLLTSSFCTLFLPTRFFVPFLLLLCGVVALIHGDLGHLLLEEVHVWLEGGVGVHAVVLTPPLAQVPRTAPGRCLALVLALRLVAALGGHVPWLGAGEADHHHEHEGEEGDGDHQGVLGNPPLGRAHAD